MPLSRFKWGRVNQKSVCFKTFLKNSHLVGQQPAWVWEHVLEHVVLLAEGTEKEQVSSLWRFTVYGSQIMINISRW